MREIGKRKRKEKEERGKRKEKEERGNRKRKEKEERERGKRKSEEKEERVRKKRSEEERERGLSLSPFPFSISSHPGCQDATIKGTLDGDNSIHQEWRSHRHFLGTSTETNLPPGDHYADDDDHHVYGDFDDQIEIPVDPVIRETFLKYEHSSLTIFPIYVIS